MLAYMRQQWLEIVAIAASGAASLSLLLFSGIRYANDDQFITYRYIDNIAAGHGFVYNLGEHVLGATTPLFVLVGALSKFILPAVPTPTLIAALNVVFISTAAVFFERIMRRFVPAWLTLTAALVFALDLSKVVPEGMESPLFILLLLWFLDSLLAEKHRAAAVLLSLALLTRPDAGLIAVLALIYWLFVLGWRESVRLVTLCVVVALPWLVFATIYFGSFVPQSLAAKLHSKDIYNVPAIQGMKVQLASYSRILWGKLFDPDSVLMQTAINLLPFLGLVVYGAWARVSRKNWIIFAIPIAYFISYSMSDPIIFPWYVTQMEPLWILLSFIGVAALMQRVTSRFVLGVVAAVLVFGPVYFWVQELRSHETGKVGLVAAATYLRSHIGPNDTIGLSNIGIVGYETNARIFDFIGLVTPKSPSFYPLPAACRDRSQLYQVSCAHRVCGPNMDSCRSRRTASLHHAGRMVRQPLCGSGAERVAEATTSAVG